MSHVSTILFAILGSKPFEHSVATLRVNVHYIRAGKLMKLRLSYFEHIMRNQGSLEKTTMLGRGEGSRKIRLNMRQIDFIKETTALSLQELIRAIEDSIIWRLLIHRVNVSQRQPDSN